MRTPSQSRWNPLIAVSRVLNRGAPSEFAQPGSAGSCGVPSSKAPSRDPPVLVGRQRGHPERLERGGDAEGVGEVEVFGDDHVFQDVVEPLRAVLDPEVEEPPEPQVEHPEDRRDQPTLGGEEGRRAPGLEQVAGAEPLDLHPEAVGVVERSGSAPRPAPRPS